MTIGRSPKALLAFLFPRIVAASSEVGSDALFAEDALAHLPIKHDQGGRA